MYIFDINGNSLIDKYALIKNQNPNYYTLFPILDGNDLYFYYGFITDAKSLNLFYRRYNKRDNYIDYDTTASYKGNENNLIKNGGLFCNIMKHNTKGNIFLADKLYEAIITSEKRET